MKPQIKPIKLNSLTRAKVVLIVQALALFLLVILVFPTQIFASTGINKEVNFQGKLVNPSTGLNVSDGTYNMEFKIYQDGDGVPGGGDETLKWTETRTESDRVTVTDGVFRVSLGSVTAFGSNVDWNQDTLWVSVNIGGTGESPSWDGEMDPMIRLSAAPYALNAEKVNGLTVTATTGTLTLANDKTFTVNNTITLSGTDSTSFTLPSTTGGTIITSNAASQSISAAFTFNNTLNVNGDIVAASTATTGNAMGITADSLSSGNILSLTSSSTAATSNTQKGLNISLSGTNSTSSQTTYGAYISNTHAGTSSTNIGLYATATGGTTANYAAIFDQGNVGIGVTAPGAKLEINTLATGNIGLIVAGVNSQSANILEAHSGYTGYTTTYFNEHGELRVQADQNNTVPLRIKQRTISQTGHLTDWADPSNNVLASVDASGNIGTSGTLISTGTPAASGTSSLLQLGTNAIAAGSANGNFIGINPTSFSGNFFEFEVNGSTVAKLDSGGILTVASCVGCGSGAQTPWASDINAAGYDLSSLSNLLFQETTGAPLGTDVGLYRDNSGDLNLNVLTGKSFNLQVNGSDQYNFSSTGITTTSAVAWDLANSSTTSLNFESGLLDLDTQNGYVGIGTASPGSKLQIEDNSAYLSFAHSGTAGLIGAYTDAGVPTNIDLWSDAASGERPTLTIYGWGESAQKTVSFGIDQYDRLYIGGTYEYAKIANGIGIDYDKSVFFNGQSGASMSSRTSQTNQALMIGVEDGQNELSRTLIIADNSDLSYNFAHTVQSNPTVFIHSANQSTTQWLSLTHDGTDAVITSGAGNINLTPTSNVVVTSGGLSITNATSNTTTLSLGGNVNLYGSATRNGLMISNTSGGTSIRMENNSTQGTVFEFKGSQSNHVSTIPGANYDSYLFEEASAGQNKQLRLYGYITAATAAKYGYLEVDDATDSLLLGTEDSNVGITLDSGTGRVTIATGDFLHTSVSGVTGATAGDIWYDSSAGKFKINEASGGTKILCNATDAGCGSGGGVSDGDKGDITVSGSGTVWNVDFTSTDGSGSTSSASGMEEGTGGIGLLQGCADGQVLKWDESSSVWQCGSDRATYQHVLGGDYTNATATFSDVDSDSDSSDKLGFSIDTNEQWVFQISTQLVSNTTADSKWRVNAPSGATCDLSFSNIEQAVSVSNVACGTSTANMAIGDSNANEIKISGAVSTTSTAGTVQLQFGENTTSGTATIYAGSYLLAYKVSGADLAEAYYSKEDGLVPGTLLSLDSGLEAGVKKSTTPYDKNLVGIVTTKPGLVLGEKVSPQNAHLTLVALSGRVPVRVNTENGVINPGDLLTSSSTPGVAMKATKAGMIVGQAMVGYDGDGEGSVLAFIKADFANGSGIPEILPSLNNLTGDVSNQVNIDQQILASFISQKDQLAASSTLSEINTDKIYAGLGMVTPQITTQTIALDQITSATDEDISLNLSENGKFLIKNDQSQEAISFDSAGNAVFKGIVFANEIQANRIKGLEIFTNKINSLDSQLATLSSNLNRTQEVVEDSVPSELNIENLAFQQEQGALIFSQKTTFQDESLFEKLVSFLSDVIFKGEVTFANAPNFNQDTAGYAKITKGKTYVYVRFAKEYKTDPIVNATIYFPQLDQNQFEDKITSGDCVLPSTPEECQNKLTQDFFSQDLKFVVTAKTAQGFVILLNKPSTDDLVFSWNALAVKDAKTAVDSTADFNFSSLNSEDQTTVLGTEDALPSPSSNPNPSPTSTTPTLTVTESPIASPSATPTVVPDQP